MHARTVAPVCKILREQFRATGGPRLFDDGPVPVRDSGRVSDGEVRTHEWARIKAAEENASVSRLLGGVLRQIMHWLG